MLARRKLEKFLKIRLVEQYKEGEREETKVKGEALTIGDLVRIK